MNNKTATVESIRRQAQEDAVFQEGLRRKGEQAMTEQTLTFEQEAAQVLEQMAELTRENREATTKQAERLAKLRAEVKVFEDEVAMINAERNEMLNNLRMHAEGLGLRAEGTIETPHGTVKFKSGYPRVTYDAKGLDAMAKAPEYHWLRDYRKESLVSPKVTVEVNE